MNDDFDDLDRALFASPLEMPPVGMREAILRATVYADVVSPLAFARWEIVGIGAALAIAVWLVILAIANRTFAETFAVDAYAIVRGFGDPNALAWLAAGGAVATLATLTNLPLPRLPVRNGRS